MDESVAGFYDQLAPFYHLIFEDWEQSIERQERSLIPLLESELGPGPLKVLDCACGIGTQSIGFARHGHIVVGSDVSAAAVERARHEMKSRGLQGSFTISNMTTLAEIHERDFDVVAALDNALPHLDAAGLRSALHAIHARLKSGGLLLASIRDYDALIGERPAVQGPVFYGEDGERRIVHQVWDWIDDTRYILHMYITVQGPERWEAHHFVSTYRCLLREDLSESLRSEEFREIRWILPRESGYYQPLVLARRG